MPTETHPEDARPNLSPLAASILIVVVGVLALSARVYPWSGSMQGSPADATATQAVAEFGD